MTFTVAVVVALFFETNRWEQGRVRMEFDQRVESLTQKLQSDFDSYLDVLRSVQNFFASSPSVSQTVFILSSRETSPIIRNPVLIMGCTRAEGQGCELSLRRPDRDGLTNFQLTERDAQLKPDSGRTP
jgi:CHASE1-domain containing sensor protein